MRVKKQSWIAVIVVVVAGILAGWVASPAHPSIAWGAFQRDLNVKLGLDLQGGSQLIYLAKTSDIPEGEVEQAIEGVRDVIERRVNAFGISEPLVQVNRFQNDWRIIIELAGIHDPQQAIELIGQTPQLDFRREVIPAAGEEPAINVDDPESLLGPQFEHTALTGRHLKRATVDFDPVLGSPEVTLEFDGEGSELFAALTKESIGKRIAIYLDGIPISAPVVQSEITNGQAVISGGFSLEEANSLARNLRAGALPVPIELVGQQQIGPSLGKISIQQSVAAGVLGIFAVMVWMIVFYRLPGVVAAVTLILYAMFFLAIVKLIPITLTLAGVAGFIMSIGMAVDANVLIFERLKENVRAGKAVPYSLEEGFREAWGSIKASNISSIITGVVLYYFGTSIIRGFAFTFTIGIILSMFTAIVITRTLLRILLASRRWQKPKWLAV